MLSTKRLPDVTVLAVPADVPDAIDLPHGERRRIADGTWLAQLALGRLVRVRRRLAIKSVVRPHVIELLPPAFELALLES